jgi:hypothetical protein
MAAQLFYTPIAAVLYRGLPSAGAKATFYYSGTTTKAPVYTADDLVTEHSNPVVADAAGSLPSIYLDDTIDYRLVLTTAAGVTIPGGDVDPYTPGIIEGFKGDPGGNVMAIGLFSGASALSIPVGTDLVRTSGYGEVGQGSADYIYDATVDSAYVAAHPRTSFRSTNGRGFRLDPQQRLAIQMFGGKADGTIHASVGPYLGTYGATDNAPALNAALALFRANVITGYYRAGPHIHFPGADGIYDFQSTVSVDASVTLTGDSGPGAGIGASILRWRPGMHGLILQFFGYTWPSIATPGTYSAGSTIIEGLQIYQHRTGNNFETEDYHGILALAPVTIRDAVVSGWSGSGIYGPGGAPESNVNNSFIANCSFYGNEHGIYPDGGDANVWLGMRIDCSNNRGYGIWDSSFLGNTWINVHTDGNGIAGGSAQGTIATMCTYLGKYYYVRVDQAVGASTNPPSGSTSNNTWWGYIGAGTADTAHPAWVSGTTFREGGAFRSDGAGNARTTWIGCYAEASNGGASYFTYPNFVDGGLQNTPVENNDASIWDNVLGTTILSTPLSVSASYKVNDQIVVGPRLPALPAAATDLPSALTLVNAIRAALKVTGGHGLVAD